jgi:hypothetical protein
MVVPCVPRFARVVRSAAAACGVLGGLAREELEDLRLLVDEVFVVILELGATAVELIVTPANGEVDLSLAAVDGRGPPRGRADATFVRMLADVIGWDVRDELDAPRPTFGITLVAAS